MNIDPHLEKLRKHLKDKLKIIRKDIEGIKKKLTGEFIQKRVNEIQLNRVDNPGKFFARAQPDSVFRSQQVWTVEYEETEKTDNSEKKIKVSSSVPEIVKREVKNAWEKIFTTKKQKNKNTNEAFLTRKFIKRREKILNKDQKLIKEITEEEVKETINQLSNGTACGPDNIPNEIIKYMSKSNQFLKLITKILNICIKQKKIPEMWKKSNIYTIYKKENPNNPLNYRPIALLCTTYKLYSTIITKRLSNFMETNECFSKMQGGFRKDRPTFTKIWTLRNIIEHAKLENKNIHVCYIDIQKAYDSVEHWALNRVLKEYGFSKDFRYNKKYM